VRRPVTIVCGLELSSELRFWLELAVAYYRRAVRAVVGKLEAKLAQLESERPPEPVTDARELAAASVQGELAGQGDVAWHG
jgi:hypothetical protein